MERSEEALKKDDEKAKGDSSEPQKTAVVAKPKRAKRATRKVQRETETAEPIQIEPLRLRPVVRTETVYDTLNQVIPLPVVSYSLSVFKSEVIINLNAEKRKRARRRAAAILLLAA